MRVIIAGSRTIRNYLTVVEAILSADWEITEVVSGREPNGVDRLGEDWAALHEVPVTAFPADWARYGRAAGPIRNRQMAEYAEALIAVWDGQSTGTANMILEAHKRNLRVFVLVPTKDAA